MQKLERLKIGDVAPDFSGKTMDGEWVESDVYRGRKLWLAFFRYASCPLCNLRIYDMIQHYEAFKEAGLEIVTVFQSPPVRLKRYVGRQTPQFPVISDPDEELYRRFSVDARWQAMLSPSIAVKIAKATALGFLPGSVDGTLARVPADFLIDESGTLVDIFYGRDIGDHIPFERVEHFLKMKAAQPVAFATD